MRQQSSTISVQQRQDDGVMGGGGGSGGVTLLSVTWFEFESCHLATKAWVHFLRAIYFAAYGKHDHLIVIV